MLFGLIKFFKKIGIKYTDEEKQFLITIKNYCPFFSENECKQLLNKCIKDAEKIGFRGVNNLGDIKIKDTADFDKKAKCGLTKEDYLKYWNRPGVWIVLDHEFSKVPSMNHYNRMREENHSPEEAVRAGSKLFIRYGNPEIPHPNFQGEDNWIYPELAIRYEKWRDKITLEEEVEIKQKYSTANAMVRDLIRKGEL